jgi:hypothetical protein
MLHYSNLVILAGFIGAIIAAFFKHFWILIMILLILVVYKGLTYGIEKYNE